MPSNVVLLSLLFDVFLCFLAILPIEPVASSLRGRAILHRLNKPLLLLAQQRNSSLTGLRPHGKASLPVFNYGGTNFLGRENELGNGTEGAEAEGHGALLDAQRQMLTALPDLSDPCFRRYANSIIVNAQPYERRSSISLVHCKLQCLRSQLGLYSCRSFVYDNINQVCDLFAHVGDQPPAKLLRFQTRDYFEPTAAIHCGVPPPSAPSSSSSSEQLGEHFPPAMGVQVPPASSPTLISGPIVWPTLPSTPLGQSTTTPVPSSSSTSWPTSGTTSSSSPFEHEEDEEGEEEEEAGGSGLTLLKPSEEGEAEEEGEEDAQQRLEGARQHTGNGMGGGHKGCLPGQVARFLRTKDFELFGQDQHRMAGVKSEQRCLDLCAEQGNASFPMPIQCNSLEYTAAHEECVFSSETAVPVGNGQLRQRAGTDYLERVCVDQRLASECQNSIYRRFPQMILVGFAETVVDSTSLQQCLDNCLNSQQLYGFRCSSGMFYFEEPQLNCILNTEDRQSQPDLFTTETSDLVDYFETGCFESRLTVPKAKEDSVPKEYEDETNETGGAFRKKDFVERTRRERLGWTQWTVCTARAKWTALGTQARWRVCAGGRVCGKEERQCILAGGGRKTSGNSGGRQSTTAPRREQRRVAALAAIGTATKQQQQKPNGGGPSGQSSSLRTLGPLAMNGRERTAQARKCRQEECCPLLGSCRLGIRFGPQGKGASWCKNPCG